MGFLGIRTTKSQSKYWEDRTINWEEKYFSTWEDPHRYFISAFLSSFNWGSLIEVGVGGGANLANIVKMIPNRMVGGIDINPDAIEFCSKKFKGGVWKTSSADNIMMSDKSSDVMLSDMTYIYVGPLKIDRYIKELRRVTRNNVVLCELYEKNPIKRIWLYLTEGYFFHNWPKLLRKHGFYDIMVVPFPKGAWENLQSKYCYLIKAQVPRRY